MQLHIFSIEAHQRFFKKKEDLIQNNTLEK